MPSSYTSLLRFELPVQGELSGTWGNVVNTAITTPVSEAIAGTTSISVGATDYTLTNGDGASANEARKMFITATGSPGAARNVICPATSKLYVFRNDTSGGFAMTLKTSAGSGVAVPAGQSRLLYCNGTNVVEAVNGFGSLTLTSLTLGTALGATSGGTGQASYAVGDLLYASSTTALSKLTVGATNAVLTVAAGIPSWVTTLPVASGGTGQTTAATAFDALKQSATTSYVGAVQLATTAEVQTGTDAAKPITPSTLRGGALVRATAQNTTSGTAIDFTGIPSWVKRIVVMFFGVSTNGSTRMIVQLGTSGGIETTNYFSSASYSNSAGTFTFETTGLVLEPTGSASPPYARYGSMVIENVNSNSWVSRSTISIDTGSVVPAGAGGKTLAGTLDRLRITTVGAADTFDGGSVNIMYE